MSQRAIQELQFFKQQAVHREELGIGESIMGSTITESQLSESKGVDAGVDEDQSTAEDAAGNEPDEDSNISHLIESFAGRNSKNRVNRPKVATIPDIEARTSSKDKQRLIRKLGNDSGKTDQPDEYDHTHELLGADAMGSGHSMAVDDFNERIAEQQPAPVAKPDPCSDEVSEENSANERQLSEPPSPSVISNAFDRMRPRRNLPDVATIKIGSKTKTFVLGSSSPKQIKTSTTPSTFVTTRNHANDASRDNFSSSMRSFAAPGSKLIKAVGGPQSKSHDSMDDSGNSRESDVLSETLSTGSAAPDDEDYRKSTGDEKSNTGDPSSDEGQSSQLWDAESDGEYTGDEEKKAREDAKVAELIRQAEDNSAMRSQDSGKRAHQILKGAGRRDSTAHLIQVIDASVEKIDTQMSRLLYNIRRTHHTSDPPILETSAAAAAESSPEERLSLTVSKTDFADMHIPGQFNLGFVLATRNNADLFIIDQHASDEKYNFERLQANTVVQNQCLVQARTLQITAIEEEIILERNEALLNNGFLVDVDTSGDSPVGQRCKLISLPMSREVTFDISDLEELISLLADTPVSASTENTPRPTKVRRMFAMRACRSSIMVGKTLTLKQMRSLVRKMGQIDKPWNCPHGRPTMRHVCGLDGLGGWREGDGLAGLEEEMETVKWRSWHTHMMERQEEISGEDHDADMQIREEFEASEDGEDREAKTSDE